MTNICLSKLAIIGSENGLLPDRRQAIIWINAEILLNRPLGTNFNRTSYIFIQENAFEKVVCKTASILPRPLWVNSLLPSDAMAKRDPSECNRSETEQKKKLGQRDPKTGSTWQIIKRPHKKSASFGTQTFSDNRWKPQIAPNPKLRPHPNLIISKDTLYKQSLLFSGTGLKT